jgi:F-type H+-transporting ATPase subunit gamma
MANLKSLKLRIKSVRSTQKITKAMKMVAASKLRKFRNQADAAAPYAIEMKKLLKSLASSVSEPKSLPLLYSSSKSKVHLLVLATSDRGLCGAFNSALVKACRQKIRQLEGQAIVVKVLCIGTKGYDLLKLTHRSLIIDTISFSGKRQIGFADVHAVGRNIIRRFEANEFDHCSIFYQHFQNAISSTVTCQPIIPLMEHLSSGEQSESLDADNNSGVVEFEPSETDILQQLLPKNVSVQLYHAILDNAASEQGARMAAMDNATRNASDMIKDLTLQYNRTRQAAITKELIEIISGAEAL